MFKRLLNFLAPYRPNLAFIKAREEAYEQAFGIQGQIFHSTDHKAPHVDLYVFPPAGQRDFVAIVTGPDPYDVIGIDCGRRHEGNEETCGGRRESRLGLARVLIHRFLSGGTNSRQSSATPTSFWPAAWGKEDQ